jgi:integrase
MKGHIKKRGRSWSIVIDVGRDPGTGKRKQKWMTVTGTKGDAQRKLRKYLTPLDEGTFVEPSKISVGEFLEQWLETYARPNTSGKTFERYAELVRKDLIPLLGMYPLQKLQPLHVQACYTKLYERLSAKTVLQHHRVLRKALQHAAKWGLVARNVAGTDLVDAPKPVHKEVRALDEIQTARLLVLARGRRFYLPVVLAVTTGMRRGEICGLRWGDVDLDAGVISVRQSLEQTKSGLRFKPPKTTKGRRRIDLGSLALDALQAHKVEQAKERLLIGKGYQDYGLVVANVDGTPYPPDSLTSSFASMIRRTKDKELKRLRFHDLRHSHATQLFRQGIHPKIVSERLGHATVSITLDLYSHVLPGMQEDAANKADAALRAAMGKVG